jgi:hypothetical protein
LPDDDTAAFIKRQLYGMRAALCKEGNFNLIPLNVNKVTLRLSKNSAS